MLHTFSGKNMPPTNILNVLSLSKLMTENFNLTDHFGKKNIYHIGKQVVLTIEKTDIML